MKTDSKGEGVENERERGGEEGMLRKHKAASSERADRLTGLLRATERLEERKRKRRRDEEMGKGSGGN